MSRQFESNHVKRTIYAYPPSSAPAREVEQACDVRKDIFLEGKKRVFYWDHLLEGIDLVKIHHHVPFGVGHFLVASIIVVAQRTVLIKRPIRSLRYGKQMSP